MKITYYANNCYSLHFPDGTHILTDPWIAGPAYDGCWGNKLTPDHVTDFYSRMASDTPDLVFISHIHNDHCHPESWLPWLGRSGKPIFLTHEWNEPVIKTLRRYFPADAVKTVKAEEGGQPYSFGALDLIVQKNFYPMPHIDSILIVRNRQSGRMLIFCNDNQIRLGMEHPLPEGTIVIWPVGMAGPYPVFCDHLSEAEKVRIVEKRKANCRTEMEATIHRNPGCHFVLCPNDYEWTNAPDALYTRLSEVCTMNRYLDDRVFDWEHPRDYLHGILGVQLQKIVAGYEGLPQMRLNVDGQAIGPEGDMESPWCEFSMTKSTACELLMGKVTWNAATIAGKIRMRFDPPENWELNTQAVMENLRIQP